MFKLLNSLGANFLSDDIETHRPSAYGINRLDDAPLHHAPFRIERDSESAREAICVVDDDPSVLRSVARLLESDGFSVTTFSEPRIFLEYVAENSVPLAILDIWMEEMTGIELLAHLCATSPETRVIFMSGHEDLVAKAAALQAGALAFFIKPFHNDHFLNAVRCAFGYSLPSMKQSVG